jgi:hypothetical protein
MHRNGMGVYLCTKGLAIDDDAALFENIYATI